MRMAIRSKYRFLFVSAPFGGIEVFFRNLQRIIGKRQDVDATWIWLDFNPKEWIAHVPPVSLNWTLKGGIVTRARIMAAEAANGRFDAALFNHTICAMFVGNFGRRVPLALSVDVTPGIMHRYRGWYQDRRSEDYAIVSKVKEAIARQVYAKARFILPWSNLVKNSLVEDYGVGSSKLDVVPPGVDLDILTKNGTGSGNGDKKGAHVNILFVGADFQRKGGDLLMTVAARREFEHCNFHIVTNNTVIKNSHNIFIHTDVKPNSEQLMKLYKSADVFVLPSRADLSPNVIAEAMAFGLPVVASDVGAVSELVQHGKNGYLVPVNDEESFACRLEELATDRQERNRMGRQARKYAEDKLDMRMNAERILDHLKDMADRSNGDQMPTKSIRAKQKGDKS